MTEGVQGRGNRVRNDRLTDFVPETENIKFNDVWIYLTTKRLYCIMGILLNGEHFRTLTIE